MSKSKICHLTSVHPRYDTRIYLKECSSLAKENYYVSLIVADGKGNEQINGIQILDVGKLKGRLNRMLKTTRLIFKEAVKQDASIYHLHDPELLPVALKLKKIGKIVVFDSHEDFPKQILSKSYLNKHVRKSLSFFISLYENFVCKKLDAIVTATPFIRNKFLTINPQSIDINNYPILGELDTENLPSNTKTNKICYVGGITSIRGIAQVVKALEYTTSDARLQLVGNFRESAVEKSVKKLKGWNKVEQLGFLNRTEVKELFAESVLGLVTFLPFPNHIDAQPNKMFEYMSAGIPVISSNFTLWRQIIEGNECGICVDPFDSEAIAQAIDKLMSESTLAKKMGNNGRTAVISLYNWAVEEQKLFNLYRELQAKQIK